jgi:glutaredoxin 3
MYTTAYCGYCRRAERLLEAKGVTEIEMVRVDQQPSARMAMMERTGRRTVPQIYIGDYHVGGYDELAALDRAGQQEHQHERPVLLEKRQEHRMRTFGKA